MSAAHQAATNKATVEPSSPGKGTATRTRGLKTKPLNGNDAGAVVGSTKTANSPGSAISTVSEGNVAAGDEAVDQGEQLKVVHDHVTVPPVLELGNETSSSEDRRIVKPTIPVTVTSTGPPVLWSGNTAAGSISEAAVQAIPGQHSGTAPPGNDKVPQVVHDHATVPPALELENKTLSSED